MPNNKAVKSYVIQYVYIMGAFVNRPLKYYTSKELTFIYKIDLNATRVLYYPIHAAQGVSKLSLNRSP